MNINSVSPFYYHTNIDMEKSEARGQIRGRPPKKGYNPEKLMQELIDTVAEIYHSTNCEVV